MATGETILSAFLRAVFEKLLSPGVSLFLKLVDGGNLRKTLKFWKSQLRMIEALLDDAEQNQLNKKSVKTWLDDLQDLAYDMEDILDEFASEALLFELKAAEEDQLAADHPGY